MKRKETYLLGVDAGTTGLKTLAFDLTGRLVCQAYREYPLSCPQPDRAEQDPEHWWQALAETTREVLTKGNIEPGQVAGLSISAQGSTFVALGPDYRPLRPALSWLDKRSAELPSYDGLDDEELFAITGLRAYPGWTGPMARWLSVHEPETLRKAERIVLVCDYLNFRLTGEIATDYSMASRTRLLDVEKKRWSPSLVAAAGLRESQLPTLGASGQSIGGVSVEGAAATGMAVGTPIMLGGFDQSCAAFGAGATTSESVMVSLGTASMVFLSSSQPTVDPQRRVTTSCHVVPDMWAIQAPIMTTGAILRWWRDHFYPNRKPGCYIEMDELAAAAPLGAGGLMLMPHFGGAGAPYWDHSSTGAFLGFSLGHTQGHVIRAILEGVAMQIRTNVDVIESLGLLPEAARLVGGGAKSSLWTGIIGDVLGKPQVRIRQTEVGTLGAAMLAGLGVGAFADATEAVRAMVPAGTRRDYDSANHDAYERLREKYMAASQKLYGSPFEEWSGVAVSNLHTP